LRSIFWNTTIATATVNAQPILPKLAERRDERIRDIGAKARGAMAYKRIRQPMQSFNKLESESTDRFTSRRDLSICGEICDPYFKIEGKDDITVREFII
jgi:hypothetical protein